MKLKVSTKDMHGDKISNVYSAEKIVNSKGTNYKYVCELGIKNELYFLDTKVLINRVGDISTKQVYDLKQVTKSKYKTPYLETELKIETLTYEKLPKGFSLSYRLYANEDLLNEIFINFKEV